MCSELNELISTLNILAQNSLTEPWYKPFIPVGGVLVGVVLGFAMNKWSDSAKESKELKNKKSCIDDELESIEEACISTFKGMTGLLDQIYEKKESLRFTTSLELSSVCFDSFYPEVVFEYSKRERELIRFTYSNVKSINDSYSWFRDSGYQKADVPEIIMKASELVTAVSRCYVNARSALGKSEYTDNFGVHTIADELGVSGPYIESVRDRASE